MCSSRSNARAGAFLLLLIGTSPAQSSETSTLQAITEFLAEYSQITDAGEGHGSETLSTHLVTGDDAPALVYERTVYDSDRDREPTSRQIIHYPCEFTTLDSESVEVISWKGFRSRETFWVVTLRTILETDYLDYTNVVETRTPDGAIDVTTSRGRVNNLALGYFRTEATARRLAQLVQQLFEESGVTSG